MNKIDKRKKYIVVLDTETCNGIVEDEKLNLDFSLVYDIGWQVVDKKGNVYERHSFCVREIFIWERELMCSAYYSNKLPQYFLDIKNGKRKVDSFYNIRQLLISEMKKYNCNTVSAHNARFDYRALNNTYRWLTKSKFRYFFPKNTIIWDTLRMATDTICKQKGYICFCERNEYLTKHKNRRVRATAEILYRYISGNNDFIENHTGLEDVEIETKILAQCLRQHKPMRKELFV